MLPARSRTDPIPMPSAMKSTTCGSAVLVDAHGAGEECAVAPE
jgi:hypothetical protein